MRISLTRRYHFAASHRLHSPALSMAENERIYGKCNSPYGHGHNYAVEVTITGPIDPDTGMIANLRDLDPFVQGEVIEAFDYKYLNEDVPEFQAAKFTGVLRSSPQRGLSGCGSKRRAKTVLNTPESSPYEKRR